MKRRPILSFYILAFAISWLGWFPAVAGSRGIAPFDNSAFQLLLTLSAVGPALAAIIVTAVSDGKVGVNLLLKPLLQWRVGAIWLILSIVTPALLFVVAKLVTSALGLAAAPPSQGDNLVAVALSVLVLSLVSNPWEEIGWRGFALPRLQSHNALFATLVIGVLWGLWHVPFFLDWQSDG